MMKINMSKFLCWIRLQIILRKWLSFKDGFGLWGFHLKYIDAKGAENATIIYKQNGYWGYWFTNKDIAESFAKRNNIKWIGG